jgi:hypothetical protein
MVSNNPYSHVDNMSDAITTGPICANCSRHIRQGHGNEPQGSKTIPGIQMLAGVRS